MIMRNEHLHRSLLDKNIKLFFCVSRDQRDAINLDCYAKYQYDIFAEALPTIFILAVEGTSDLPRDFQIGGSKFERLLDKMFIPVIRDKAFTIAIWNACAASYERIVDTARNIENANRLVEIALERLNSPSLSSLKILDYGCGTGLSVSAALPGWLGQLFGYDPSPTMVEAAKNRGLRMIERNCSDHFDIIFASYVLHLGLQTEDVQWIINRMKDDSIFIGNWLHGLPNEMRRLSAQFVRCGKGECEILLNHNQCTSGPIMVFKK